MRKETAMQVQSEIESVESEIHKQQYHLTGINQEKRKTEQKLHDLQWRLKELKSY